MNLDDWIDAVIRELRLEGAVERDHVTDLTLDVARDVAHAVERRAAPITTFLLGVAAGRADDPKAAATSYAATVVKLLDPDEEAVAEGSDHPVEEVGGEAGGRPA